MDQHTLDCLDFARIREKLAEYALCGLGKSLALHIRPVARADLVRRWLAQVQEMQQLDELRGLPPFGGIGDVRDIVQRCAPPLRVSVDEVARVAQTLDGTHAVATHLRDLPESMPELRHLAGRVGDFSTIAARIRAVIDERGQVRDEASPKLSQIRRKIADADAEIRIAVDRLLRDPAVRRLLQYPNATFHNDRTVLPLKTEYRGRLPGIVHRHSDSGATLYVEPAIAVELNNWITNLRSEEDEEIARLLWALAHEIHVNEAELLKTLDALAVLDLLIAKVRFAKDYELRCPEVLESPQFRVRQARHPLLLELVRRRRAAGEPAEEVVPIDYRLGEDFDLLIITGPNTGGKTVTLKTVGLISLMFQAGLPVPVGAGSAIGLFASVLIDIGDEQSMQQSLSTFSAHLRRLMEMLRKAGERTLILVDELGAGTDPDEGAALGRAVLDELLRVQTRCIVTTHLGALKGYALTRPRSENASVEFDIQTLRPTYHLRIGEPGHSNAIEIAQRLGMPRRLIVSARKNLSRRARALKAVIEGTTEAKRQAEQARQVAESSKLAAIAAQSAAETARAAFERQQADFQQWVQRVVHLQAGDAVRVRGFERDGKIVRMRIDQHRAEVDVGKFVVEVPLGDVLPPETPAPPPRPPRSFGPPEETSRRGRRLAARRAREGEFGKTADPARSGGLPGDRAHGARARAERHHGERTGRAEGPPRERKPHVPPSLSDEQALALKPGDRVYAKRFHHAGEVVRVIPNKKIAVVSVGLYEVELPFSGLASPPQK